VPHEKGRPVTEKGFDSILLLGEEEGERQRMADYHEQTGGEKGQATADSQRRGKVGHIVRRGEKDVVEVFLLDSTHCSANSLTFLRKGP